jgi:Methyltransferase domain
VEGFATFVLHHLPPPPGRVLEVGCGPEGGLVATLVESGYDAIGVDPEAPAGERFRRVRLQEVGGEFDAVVAGRVLHHVEPLGPGLDHLAARAPLLVVDEFAPDIVEGSAQRWYERRRRELVDPAGPESLDDWRDHHPGLHPHGLLLAELRARYEERVLEWAPYFHRWLQDEATERLEREAIAAGDLPAIGWRWCGLRR